MTENPAPHITSEAHLSAQKAGILLREAASVLHLTMRPGEVWMELPFHEKAKWGARVAPAVLATLLVTKPQGWEDLSRDVTNTAERWVHAGVEDQ